MNRMKRSTRILITGLFLIACLGNTSFLRSDSTHLPFASVVHEDVPDLQTQTCGTERWAIKTGIDSEAKKVELNPVTTKSLADLINLPAPNILPDNRIPDVEYTVYTITATLIGYIREDDQDYHLVLRDQGNTMIAEIPNPSCVGGNSPFIKGITSVRDTFDNKFTGSKKPTGTFKNVDNGGVLVRITGVGFFDKIHGQTGVAPNGIELHPVLDIVFDPPLKSWEYKLTTAKSAEDLRDGLVSDGEDGWELVDVIFDSKRSDPYVAYLKRQKP